MPVKKDLDIWKGNTFVLPLKLYTKTDTTLTPINLTGSVLVFKSVYPTGTLRITSASTGFVITDALNGEATLTISALDTRSLPNGGAKYEIERHIGDHKTTLLYGTLKCLEWVDDD